MMTGGTGLPERALAPEGSRRPRQQNPRLGMARHRIPDRTAGAGRPQAACVHVWRDKIFEKFGQDI